MTEIKNEKMRADSFYHKRKFLKTRRAFAKSECNQIRDKIILHLLEQGIQYDDFMVYDYVDEYCTRFSLRTVKSPMPPQFRFAVIQAFNFLISDECNNSGGSVIRLVSEFHEYVAFDPRKLESDAMHRVYLEFMQDEIHTLYLIIEDWKRSVGLFDDVTLWPGFCETTGVPRIYISVTENPGCISKFRQTSDPEQVKAFIRTLPEYEAPIEKTV